MATIPRRDRPKPKSICINSEIVVPSFDENGQIFNDFDLQNGGSSSAGTGAGAGIKGGNTSTSNKTSSAGNNGKGRNTVLIGQGAFGKVMIIRSKRSGFLRACKQVKIETKADMQMLQTEIEAMKALDHPNICRLYRCYHEMGGQQQQSSMYLVLELCEGGTLQDAIDKAIAHGKAARTTRTPRSDPDASTSRNTSYHYKCFDLVRTAQYTQQILSALSYCHSRNLIHRDIKPENILLSQGIVKIIDFGLADFLDRIDNRMRCGTCHYMAPEIHRSCHYTQFSDVFAVGVLVYVMTTGKHPYFDLGRDDYKSCRARILASDPDWRRFLAAVTSVAVEVGPGASKGAAANRAAPGAGLRAITGGAGGGIVAQNSHENGNASSSSASSTSTAAIARMLKDARHLCAKLVEKDPRKRLSARQAMAYPYVKNNSMLSEDDANAVGGNNSAESQSRTQGKTKEPAPSGSRGTAPATPTLPMTSLVALARNSDAVPSEMQSLFQKVFSGLHVFAKLDRLTQATLRLLAKELDEPHICDEFRKVFRLIDDNGDGLINRGELVAAEARYEQQPPFPDEGSLPHRAEGAGCSSSSPTAQEHGMRRLAAALGSQNSECLTYRDLLAGLYLLPLGRSEAARREDIRTGATNLLADIFPRFSLEQETGITRSSLRYSLAPSTTAKSKMNRATGLNGFERVTSKELDAIFSFYDSSAELAISFAVYKRTFLEKVVDGMFAADR
eukprot:g10360.t1